MLAEHVGLVAGRLDPLDGGVDVVGGGPADTAVDDEVVLEDGGTEASTVVVVEVEAVVDVVDVVGVGGSTGVPVA